MFAREDFDFSDYRVAELITGYGRLIHKQLEKLATSENYGFETIFGFTDSIFIRNVKTVQSIQSFITECHQKFGITLEHKNRFKSMVIFDKQNSFIAWTGRSEDKPILKNLNGMSGRYPNWIKDKIDTIASHIITNPYTDIISLMKQAFSELESGRVNTEDLMYTAKLSKEPSEYVNKNDRGKVLGLQFAAHKGDIVHWYESDSKKRYSIDPIDISTKKYKEILWNKIKEILEITNYNTEEIEYDLLIKDEIRVPRHQQI